jgi:hypothetical protein
MKQKTYTDEQLIDAVKNSTSIRQVLIFLKLSPKGGGSCRSIGNNIKLLQLDISHFTGKGWSNGKLLSPKRPTEDYLSNKNKIHSFNLKNRLVKEGVFIWICTSCKQTEWMDHPIPLELDHIDGNHYNNNLNNLRLLCPNCHAMTPTHAGKNKGKAKYKP